MPIQNNNAEPYTNAQSFLSLKGYPLKKTGRIFEV